MTTLDDGCTGIPDVIFGTSIRHCCDAHDQALGSTMDWLAFDPANVAFAHCVWDTGLWWFVLPALFVVPTVGALFFRFGPKRGGDDPRR